MFYTFGSPAGTNARRRGCSGKSDRPGGRPRAPARRRGPYFGAVNAPGAAREARTPPAAAPGGCVQNLGGSGQVYVTSGGSGQAFGGHSGSGQMLRAPGGYSLGAMPSLVSGQAAGQSVRLSMKNGEKETRESPGLPAAAAVQQEVGGGEGGEEYLQELIKERDAIETSSSSSLSKTHILRLLNKGKYSTVGYSIETIAPPAASPRPIFSGLSIKVNILDIP